MVILAPSSCFWKSFLSFFFLVELGTLINFSFLTDFGQKSATSESKVYMYTNNQFFVLKDLGIADFETYGNLEAMNFIKRRKLYRFA